MILKKGGVGIENTILFGKYQLGPVIGQGRSGTVWLATHLGLEERRAIKRVPKELEDYDRFRREALLLKELRHPGIPIVYDLEEDNSYCYLIEEYLEGNSLYDVVRHQRHLNQDTVIRYGIQICDLVQYLHSHSAGQDPILYLDLQPKNLLLCHEVVKLIDFDHSARLLDANEDTKRYGTPGCCAPEQMNGEQELDIRTDVYAIGCILYFMRTGVYQDGDVAQNGDFCERELARIIRTCLREKKEERYQSAGEIKLALLALTGHVDNRKKIHMSGIGVFSKNNISSLVIALAGSKSGVGTTHLSISLSGYLRHQGYPNLYEEHNRSGAVWQTARYMGLESDSYGIFNMQNILCKPAYGEAVRLKEHPYRVVVRDYGTDWEEMARQTDIQVRILVHGGKWWDAADGDRAFKAFSGCPDLVVLYNHTLPGISLKAPEGAENMRCFFVPYFCDPLLPGILVTRFWDAVTGPFIRTGKGEASLRNGIRRTAGKICRRIGLSALWDWAMEQG